MSCSDGWCLDSCSVWVHGRSAAQGTVAGTHKNTRLSRTWQHGSRKQWHIRADRSGKATCTNVP